MTDKENIFQALIKDHKRQVYRVCWGFTSNPHDVEDLFQETMINIWRGFEGFKGASSPSTWIYRVTVNTCIFWKKKEAKNIKSDSRSIIVDEVASNENSYLIKEQIQSLKTAIQSLKEIDKSIMLLLLEECSYNDIAEITGLNVSNVGVRISRIKTRLKEIMQTQKSIV